MTNITIYKKTLSLLTATAILFTLTGCKKENIDDNISTEAPQTNNCTHLSIGVGGEYETYKECEGYDICLKTNYGAGIYSISIDDEKIIDGIATDYNIMQINHNFYQSDNKILQKSKTK